MAIPLKTLEKLMVVPAIVLFALISTKSLANNRLMSFEQLLPGESIKSPNGIYKLEMQSDGNLVLSDDIGKIHLWSTDTAGHPKLKDSNGFVEMFGQGAFGLRSALDTDIQIYWNSQSWGHPGAHLRVQDDGNMVVYNSDGQPVWVSNTYQGDCHYEDFPTYFGDLAFCSFVNIDSSCSTTQIFISERFTPNFVGSALNSCTSRFETCVAFDPTPGPAKPVRICEN
ncbi:hypothetical protein [Microbulbifer discodermiae]|uniref:hypothetical protein n=1 Tax=Microbulbifer sp. 2201CG32-9 TaxID=3232309 RepID=UPI00345BD5BC